MWNYSYVLLSKNFQKFLGFGFKMYYLEANNLSLSIPIFQSNRLFDQSNSFSESLLGSKKEVSNKNLKAKS